MAGDNTFFLTGATCKIKIGRELVALATDISCTVTVNHVQPRLLGQYEADDIQPVSYQINGQLTIIRYTRGLKKAIESEGGSTPNVLSEGNSVGSYNNTKGLLGSGLVGLKEADVGSSFDPSKFFVSEKFNIEILQATATDEDSLTPVVRIEGCRFTTLSISVTKRGLAQQSYQFSAQYFSDDTFIARPSGRIGVDRGLF